MLKQPNQHEEELLHEVKRIIGSMVETSELLEKENAFRRSKRLATGLKRLAHRLSEIIEDEFWSWVKRKGE